MPLPPTPQPARPATVGLDLGPPPKGWDRDVWTLTRTLDTAVRRLPYSTAAARALDGCQRWLRYSGHKTKGPWWATFLQFLTLAVQLADDPPSTRLLAPWLALTPRGQSGFRPFDGTELGGPEPGSENGPGPGKEGSE